MAGGTIDDRRAAGRGVPRPGMALGGGAGLLGIVVLVLTMCMGGGGIPIGNLDDLTGALGAGGPAEPATDVTLDPAADPDAGLKDYMEAVYADLDATWSGIFTDAGRATDYRTPGFVVFEGFTDSGCGGADERVGPHYCPPDETMYLDFDFFTELSQRFGAQGDFAPAYVIAHEFGHHIQTLLGISEEVSGLQQQNPDQANELSILTELQADCFAGVWVSTLAVGTDTGEAIEIDPGEIQEALDAAEAVGDDRIQAQAGQVNPETWTHGSAEQRAQWTMTGYESGDPAACNTFSG